MREIKFRIWSPIHREFWFKNFGELFDLKETDLVMQFTGLKDKNGKEIYEGDIVKFYDDVVGVTDEGIVAWDDKFACFKLNAVLSNHGVLLEGDEVIGNVYENHELLKRSS